MNGEIRTHAAHRRSDGFADRGLNPLDYVHILVLPMRVERISVAYKATALTTELWQYNWWAEMESNHPSRNGTAFTAQPATPTVYRPI